VIVYGHRGARGEAPENTIAGCRHAVSRGVRHIEIDLRLSSDRQLVVIHDDKLVRTAAVAGKVGDYSARELAGMDARSGGTPWPNKRGTGVPTLSALLRAVPQIRHWQLELKGGSRRYNANLVDALVEWLEGRTTSSVVTSSDTSLLAAVRQRLPRQPTGYVSTRKDPDAILQRCGCTYLIAHWSTLDRVLVRRVQRKGIHVSAWTVNDASVIENLYRLGVDSVISDFPSMALPLVAALQR